MKYGKGWWWHKLFKFPKFPIVTRTLTAFENIGYPYAIVPLGNSIWNHLGLHNIGLTKWLKKYYKVIQPDNIIISIAGSDYEIETMVATLEYYKVKGIELNFSCPNVEDYKNKKIPKSNHKLYLKLNHTQDPYRYDLNKIEGISVNSIPKWKGGISGKLAQHDNWTFIGKFIKEGLPVAGASWISFQDMKRLMDIGVVRFQIGTVMLINPKLVEKDLFYLERETDD